MNSRAEFEQELLQNNMTGKVTRNLIENCDYHIVKQNALDLEISVQCPRCVKVSSGTAYKSS